MKVKLRQVKIGNMWKYINTISCVIIAGFCSAQKPMVQLILNPKSALVGEEISVTVKTNVRGQIDITFPPAFVQGYNVMNGMEQEMDGVTGKSETYYYHSVTGYISKEGTYSFGPAYVNVKRGNVYHSNKGSIKIEKEKLVVAEDISMKQIKKPAFGVIEKSKDKIFEGEPLILSSKVYTHFNPTHLEDYQSYELEGAIEKHEIGASQQIMIEQKNVKGNAMFYFEYDKQVLFPSVTGRVLVKPFKMNLKSGFDGYALTSSGLYINVVPLPANTPSDFTGGVGSFSFTRSIDKTTFKQGDIMEMKIEITGEGNIHDTPVPKLNLPDGMLVYGDPIIDEDFSFGIQGSQGSIKYTYNIQLTKSGEVKIPSFSFSYFDVSTEKYTTLTDDDKLIKVEENPNFVAKNIPISANKSGGPAPLAKGKEYSKTRETSSLMSSPLLLVSIISPLLVAFLFLFGKRKKKEMITSKVTRLQPQISTDQAWSEILQAEKFMQEGRRDDFYSSIQQSLFLLCSAELKTTNSIRLTKNEIIDQFKSKNVSMATMEELKHVTKVCEEARYGLSSDSLAQDNLLEKTKMLMEKISTEFSERD